ncbi:hypothetical protein HK405_014183, partial [Cladochytrium tenue]
GLHVVDRERQGMPEIIYLPRAGLPADAKARLRELFAACRRWTRPELMPYVEDLVDDAKKLEPLLLKYARVSRPAVGDALYTPRGAW